MDNGIWDYWLGEFDKKYKYTFYKYIVCKVIL